MRRFCFALVLFCCTVLVAQDNMSNNRQEMKDSKGAVTVQGCVGRSSGDYVLTKQNPPMTYELQASGKTRLKNYLGQRVEVTGNESATMSSSSDAINKTGSASSVTLTVTSIRTIDKECTVRKPSDQ